MLNVIIICMFQDGYLIFDFLDHVYVMIITTEKVQQSKIWLDYEKKKEKKKLLSIFYFWPPDALRFTA